MKKIIIFVIFTVIYIVTCVPVGLFIYSMKSDLGINVFSKTGYHAYLECLSDQVKKIETSSYEIKKKTSPEKVYEGEGEIAQPYTGAEEQAYRRKLEEVYRAEIEESYNREIKEKAKNRAP